MKETFNRLPKEKRQRIIDACIEEFGAHSYATSSTDRIIRLAGISKGGLYEYISSKEELFIYIVEYVYDRLYNHLAWDTGRVDGRLTKVFIDRMYIYAESAVDFFIRNPACVSLIVNTHKVSDRELEKSLAGISRNHFERLFDDCDFSDVNIPRRRAMDLASWLIIKTRYDFLSRLKEEPETGGLKEDYLLNWKYVVRVMRYGICGMSEGVSNDLE